MGPKFGAQKENKLGSQLGPMSITKLSPNWACQMGPIHCINFLLSGPPLWNKLPPALRQMSDPSYELPQTSPLAISPQLFHSKLKTLLFSKSYPDSSSSPYLPPRLNSKHHPP